MTGWTPGTWEWAAALLALGLLIYLVAALLRPEDFS
jgi:K+-transporting ATPase KdpF subunit